MARRVKKAAATKAAPEEPEPLVDAGEMDLDQVDQADADDNASKEEEEEEIDDNEQEDDEDEDDEDDEDEGSSEEEVYVEPNLATRSRRANAGARMAALIEDEASAKVEQDEMFKEEENDEEFAQKEEKDEFDSDFGSTDEGEGDEEDDEEAGERKLQNEAKEAKKAARGKKKGFQAPVHPFARQSKAARKAAARQPVASTSATTLDGDEQEPPKKRKKVAVDPAFLAPQRESSRRTAVEIRKQVQDRAKESEQRKATAPKQQRKAAVSLSQADLIAEALETEETNRAALLAFYAAEEDRREAERIAGMRYEIIGPKLTFLSRVQDRVDKGKGKEGEKIEKGRKRMIEVLGETGQKGWKGAGGDENAAAASNSSSAAVPKEENAASMSATPATLAGILNPLDPNFSPSAPPEAPEYARNWLVFDNFEGDRAEELEAIFGDHIDWSKPAAFPTRVTRKDMCPITGLPARYRDPRTLTPYATLAAYHAIRAVVDAQAFVWSETLGAYTAAANFGIMRDVEASWARRPQPPGALPRYAATTPYPTAKAGTFGNIASTGTGVKVPRQRQPVSSENPYRVEYAHAGGSGRGQRGRSSTGAADSAAAPPPSAMHPVQVKAAPAAPAQPAQQQPQLPAPAPAPAPHGPPHGLQPTIAPQHYNTDDVYRQSSNSAPKPAVVTPLAEYANVPQQASSPSLVGTSSAPQARSIQFGAGRTANSAFGGAGAPSPGAGSSVSPIPAATGMGPGVALPLPGSLPPLPPA